MRSINCAWLTLLLIACTFVAPFVAKTAPPGQEKVVGPYVNGKYLYSVAIPARLTAYRMAAPAPNQGIAIYFSRNERDFVWVNADFDVSGSGLDRSAAELSGALSGKYGLKVINNSPRQVLGLHARDITLQGDRPEAQVRYVRLLVAMRSLSTGQPVIYTIGVQARFRTRVAEEAFSAIVASFELLPIG